MREGSVVDVGGEEELSGCGKGEFNECGRGTDVQ